MLRTTMKSADDGDYESLNESDALLVLKLDSHYCSVVLSLSWGNGYSSIANV